MDAVHFADVLGWIKQAHIAFPHRQVGEPAVCGSLSEDAAGVGVPLDGDDGGVSKDKISEQPSSSPGKKVHCMHLSVSMLFLGLDPCD